MDVIPHRKHDPLCDEAWVWDAFMDGREINGAECWMCGLLSKADARARADQDRRNAAAELTRLAQEMGMIP